MPASLPPSRFRPYDTCMNYAACSSESSEGLCSHGDWTCNAMNTCRTCSTFSDMGGKCVGIDTFPNASIAEYGSVQGEDVSVCRRDVECCAFLRLHSLKMLSLSVVLLHVVIRLCFFIYFMKRFASALCV